MRLRTQQHVDRQALRDTNLSNNKDVPWWKDRGLRKLNFMLFFLMFSEFTQGYDASLINNVQQLTVWQREFHHPHGNILGAMSAAYWIG
ncbi:hypothetical protein DTO195F2_4693 [Paecilomyces variotii]|nr:hypothetical protein DTO195F2_4693 [Paecilomyces variotii]KAJ9401641.1 hypothetical protein DTO282F9_1411 [Paecilomyces variotii]